MKELIVIILGGFMYTVDKWDWESLGENAECSRSEDMSGLV